MVRQKANLSSEQKHHREDKHRQGHHEPEQEPYQPAVLTTDQHLAEGEGVDLSAHVLVTFTRQMPLLSGLADRALQAVQFAREKVEQQEQIQVQQYEQGRGNPIEAQQRQFDVQERQRDWVCAQELLVRGRAKGDCEVEPEQKERDVDVARVSASRISRVQQFIQPWLVGALGQLPLGRGVSSLPLAPVWRISEPGHAFPGKPPPPLAYRAGPTPDLSGDRSVGHARRCHQDDARPLD